MKRLTHVPDNSPPASQTHWLARFWEGQYFRGPLERGDALRYWRERIVFFLYLFGSLGGLVSLGLDTWHFFPQGNLHIVLQTGSAVALGWLFLFLGHRTPFVLRAGAVVGLMYLLGMGTLLNLGPVSNGLPILICFAVAGAALFGRRGALLAWLTLVLSLGGVLVYTQASGVPLLWGETPQRLLVLFGNNLLFAGLAAGGVAALVHGLRSSVLTERLGKEDLDSQRAELTELNQRLSQEVRTRRGIQEALFQSRAQMRTVLDALEARVYVADMRNHEVLFANRKLRQDIGQDPLGGPCWRTVGQGQDGPCEFCTNYLLLDLEGRPLPEAYYWEMRDPRGGRWLALHDRAMYWLDGRLVRLCVALDISDRVQAEETRRRLEGQLRQAQKMEAVGTLAGGMAHDFNNILAMVLGQAEQGLKQCRQGGDGSTQLGKVMDACERARDLIRRILAFSRKVEPSQAPLDLNHDVRQAVQMLQHTIPKMIAIETHLAPDLLPVTGDSSQVQQVIINLATNAADAMPQGGRLVIETSSVELDQEYCRRHLEVNPGPHALLMVTDTGTGMDSRTLGQAFDPFFTTKEVGRGTGLGLSTVHGIVKSMGGHIFAYSEPGMGATFKIYLPAQAQDQAALAPPAPAALPEELLGGSETILLVDDEPSLLEMGAVTLEEMGYRTLTADCGEQALDIYRQHGREVDLVVMDLGMPGMGGHQALVEILALDPQARVMIASGYSANGLVRQSLQGGALAYVAKPFRRVDLLASVRQVLDRPRG